MSKWYVAFFPSSTQVSRVSRIRASAQASLNLQHKKWLWVKVARLEFFSLRINDVAVSNAMGKQSPQLY